MAITIDGPFPVYELDLNGLPTEVPALGEHYSVDPPTYNANADALALYVVEPVPLQRVWAGDNPASPPWHTGVPDPSYNTVPLRFPDALTAETVIGELVDVAA